MIDILEVKRSLRILAPTVTESGLPSRVPVAVTLPIFMETALPRPCPSYPPNFVVSVLKRFGTAPPRVNRKMLRALKAFTRDFCEKNIKKISYEDVDFEGWLESWPQPRARKEELRKVWEADPYDDPSIVFRGTEIKSFMKDEPYPTYKAPRSINARSDWFKAYSGPLFDAINNVVLKALPQFIKTVPVLERPEELMEALWKLGHPVQVGDATSYEAHFTREVMEAVEFVLYEYCVEGCPSLEKQVEVIKSVLTGKQVLRFKYLTVMLEATRMSGEMNTSLGNGFTTLIIVLFLAFTNNAGEVSTRVEGDDNATCYQFPERAPTREDYKQKGWIVEIEKPSDISTASFCGNVFDPEDLIVVTDPRPHLANFGYSTKKYVKATYALRLQLLRSKALSLAHQYNGCPILGALGRRVCELTNHVRIRESVINNMELYKREQFRIYCKSPLPPPITIPSATRSLVERLYGITVEDQRQLEEDWSLLTLDSSFSIALCYPSLWDLNYDTYSVPIEQEWIPPLPVNYRELRQLIESFGKTTAEFCVAYYR